MSTHFYVTHGVLNQSQTFKSPWDNQNNCHIAVFLSALLRNKVWRHLLLTTISRLLGILESFLKNKLIAFKKHQSRVQFGLCSSNRLEIASKRVKIIIQLFFSILEMSIFTLLLAISKRLELQGRDCTQL